MESHRPKISHLLKCFHTILSNKELELREDIIQAILTEDLGITECNDKMKPVLFETIPYYMQKWPGWQRASIYLTEGLSAVELYQKFSNYLVYKLNSLLRDPDKYWVNRDATNNNGMKDAECQTDRQENPVNAPYAITIFGLPRVVTNLVFFKVGSNMESLQHMPKNWQPLELNELLNWPNISVSLRLPDISLTRANMHECHRFFTLSGNNFTNPENIFLDKIEETAGNHQVFSHEVLVNYVRQLTEIFSSLKNNDVYYERAQDILAVLNQFLKDVEYVNVNDKTVCTNVTISFNIGKAIYSRNRRLAGVEKGEICYRETFIPRIQFNLIDFNAEQVESTKVSYKSLARLEDMISKNKEKFTDIFSLFTGSCLTYKCLFCNIDYVGSNGKQKILTHLETDHQNELNVKCNLCNKQFDIKHLAGTRWTHDCSNPTTNYRLN